MKTFVPPKVDHLTFAEAVKVCARAGMSRQHTANHLGMVHSMFRAMLEDLGPIEWAEYGNTALVIERMQKRRGMSTPALRAAADIARAARSRKYHRTLRGVTGSIEELIAHFKPPMSERAIRQRLKRGADLETAFFAPAYEGRTRKCVKYTYRGFTGSLMEIFDRHPCPVAYSTFRTRVVQNGWPIHLALTAPARSAIA